MLHLNVIQRVIKDSIVIIYNKETLKQKFKTGVVYV